MGRRLDVTLEKKKSIKENLVNEDAQPLKISYLWLEGFYRDYIVDDKNIKTYRWKNVFSLLGTFVLVSKQMVNRVVEWSIVFVNFQVYKTKLR